MGRTHYFLYEDGDRWTREQYLRCSECEGCSVEELGRILGVYSPCILLRVTALGAQEPPVAIRTLTYAETGLGDMPRPFLPGSPPPEPRRTFSFSVELKPESAPVTQYRWDFGDGAQAITAGNSVSHSYSSDGEYRVLVTAVGANCDEGSALSRGLFLRIDEPGAPPERLEASRVYNEFGVERPNVFVGHEATRAQLEIGPDGSPRGRVVPHTVAFYTYVWPGAEGLHPEHPVTFWVQYPEGGEAIEFPAEPADGDRSEALWRECLWRADIDFSRIQPKPGASRDGAPLRVFYTVFPAGGTDPLMVSRGTEVEAWDLPLPWRSDFALGDYVTAKLSFEPKRRAYRLEGKFPNGRNGVADLSSPIVLGDLCLWDGACLAEDVRIENRARAALSSALFFTLDDARYDRFPAELAGELLVQFLDRKLVDESFPVRSIGCLSAQDAGKLCFRLCKPAIFSGSRTIFEYTVPIFDAWIVTVTSGARLRMDYGIDGGIEVAFDPLASPPLDLDAELCWRFKVLLHFYGKICGFRFFDIADVTLLERDVGTDEPWDLWEPLHGEELPGALAPGAGAGFEFPLILREGADRLRLSAGAAPGETHLKDNSAERTIGLWKPTGLACSQDPSGGPDAVLSWDPLAPGIEVAIAGDGRPVAIAAGSSGSFVETGVPPGSHTWTLTAQLEGMRSLPAACRSGVAEYRCLFSVAPATLRLGDAQGATTHLLADLIPDFALRGFSAGIAHDRERLVLTAADFAGTAFEGAPFQEVDFVEGGVNATAILAADPASWPEGAGVKLLRLAYRARPWTEARDGETAILLRSDLGAGRVPVAFQAPSGAWEDAATRAGRIEILAAAGPRFRRGDANSDGRIDVSDAVATLGYLFLGSEKPGCLRACDADADGRLAITDPIRLLNYLFLGGDAPAPPFPGCGLDPSPEAPSCEAYPEDLCR